MNGCQCGSYLKMLSRSWSRTLPSSTILLTTELILLYLTQSYVFCQQRETRKGTVHAQWTFAKVVLYLEMLSRSWSRTLPSSTILLTAELILLYLTQSYVFCQQRETRKGTVHAQWTFAKVVLYLEMLSRSWSTTVPDFMLVSGKAQSLKNLALSRLATVNY